MICQHICDNVNNSSSPSPFPLHTETPFPLIVHAKDTWHFIAFSYILQAAKDILYWKGNASSLQTVSIRQCGLCTKIQFHPDAVWLFRPFSLLLLILLYWWQTETINRGQFSAWLENHPNTPNASCRSLLYQWSSGLLWSLCGLLFYIHRHKEMHHFVSHSIDFSIPDLVCKHFASDSWVWNPFSVFWSGVVSFTMLLIQEEFLK